MSKKLLVLKSSPREHGNSAVLANQAAQGAKDTGAIVESFFLAGMDIRPCDGCDYCREAGACIIEDDMQKLYPKLLQADAILLASPIYWFTYNAQLKTCIDRWYALWLKQHDAFKGKSFGFVLTYGDPDLYLSGAINAIHTYETMCRFLEAEIGGWVYGTLSNIGDAQKSPELMENAYQLGMKLAH